jgi:hypothetical protein
LRPIFNWYSDEFESKASDYRIEVIAPDGAVLGSRITYDTLNSGSGYNIEDSMMEEMWVDIENVIHFHPKVKYDKDKKKNIYGLRIFTYRTGEVYELTKEIRFSKDGDQGT